jgi:hypothetical protein
MYEMTAHRPAFKAFVSWAILLTGERFLGVIHLKKKFKNLVGRDYIDI